MNGFAALLNSAGTADTTVPTGGLLGGGGSMIIMLVALVAVFYFMIIRPENKKKKEAEELRNALKKGDSITTIGGIVGTICSIKDDKIVIETSEDQVRMELMKWAVMTNNTAEEDKKKKADAQKAEMKERAAERQREKDAKKAAKKQKKAE